ncbi:ABC transporter substrate-binding protein [Polymorphospora rubra]|uniref:ABC transporter substrate-binding protein n=1 Tax=Polymorphospora rubra TaxID=338584 RepID=UPI0033CF6BF1
MLWRRIAAATAAVVTVAGVAGCADSRTDQEPAGVVEVTVLTGFGSQPQDAALLMADANGHFAKAGLEVTVRPGKGTGDNISVMLGGQADFAIVDLTGAIIQIPKIEQGGIRAVAAIYQRSISTITTLPGRGIDRPTDLEGKTIGFQPGGVNHTLFPAYAAKARIDPAKVRWQQMPPAQIRGNLASGKVDAVTETVIGTPGVRALAQAEPVVLPYGDVLSDLYGNVLITSTDTITADPDLVARFRAAFLQGLEDTIRDPAAAAAVFVEKNSGFEAGPAAEEISQMQAYVRAGGVEIGTLDPHRVMQSIALLQGVGAVPGQLQLRPEDVVHIPCEPGVAPGLTCTV